MGVAKVREREVQAVIHEALGGMREVELRGIGRVDILTDDEVIEVKEARSINSCTHALGQLLSYMSVLVGKRGVLYLYDAGEAVDKRAFEYVCEGYGVSVEWLVTGVTYQ